VTAVNDVTLRLVPGEILGLIGPNGSGKSTLLSCLSGVQRPDSGSVEIDGQRPLHWSPLDFARSGVGRTFQNIRLFGGLTAIDNVRAAISARGEAGATSSAAALLDEFGLSHVALRRACTLAYGDQRRLEIARALATAPSYLLLDEPTAGMNPSESSALMGILRHLRDSRGLGILVVDHDLHLILSLCDRVLVLNEGRLIADGTPAAIRSDPVVDAAYFGYRHGRGRPHTTSTNKLNSLERRTSQ
jgi:ABC-type branched-subunit amino acid transport system ATPase component